MWKGLMYCFLFRCGDVSVELRCWGMGESSDTGGDTGGDEFDEAGDGGTEVCSFDNIVGVAVDCAIQFNPSPFDLMMCDG